MVRASEAVLRQRSFNDLATFLGGRQGPLGPKREISDSYSLQGGIVAQVPLAGGLAKVLHAEQLCGNTAYGGESNIIAVNGSLYWTDNPISCGGVYETNVNRISISGGQFMTLFSKNTTMSAAIVNGLVFYSGEILFGYDYFSGTGGIYKVPSTGGTTSEVSSAVEPVSLVISSGKLYYSDSGLGQIDEIPA